MLLVVALVAAILAWRHASNDLSYQQHGTERVNLENHLWSLGRDRAWLLDPSSELRQFQKLRNGSDAQPDLTDVDSKIAATRKKLDTLRSK